MKNKPGFTHSQLVEIAYRWALSTAKSGIAVKEMKSISWEIADVLGFGGSVHSLLIECKVSRSDFLADRKKPFRIHPQLGMGSHRVYCVPEGLVRLEELPPKWGLLEVKANGKTRFSYRPDPEFPEARFFCERFAQERSIKAEWGIMYSALLRLRKAGLLADVVLTHEKAAIQKKTKVKRIPGQQLTLEDS